jgi:hypothetical protein
MLYRILFLTYTILCINYSQALIIRAEPDIDFSKFKQIVVRFNQDGSDDVILNKKITAFDFNPDKKIKKISFIFSDEVYEISLEDLTLEEQKSSSASITISIEPHIPGVFRFLLSAKGIGGKKLNYTGFPLKISKKAKRTLKKREFKKCQKELKSIKAQNQHLYRELQKCSDK